MTRHQTVDADPLRQLIRAWIDYSLWSQRQSCGAETSAAAQQYIKAGGVAYARCASELRQVIDRTGPDYVITAESGPLDAYPNEAHVWSIDATVQLGEPWDGRRIEDVLREALEARGARFYTLACRPEVL